MKNALWKFNKKNNLKKLVLPFSHLCFFSRFALGSPFSAHTHTHLERKIVFGLFHFLFGVNDERVAEFLQFDVNGTYRRVAKIHGVAYIHPDSNIIWSIARFGVLFLTVSHAYTVHALYLVPIYVSMCRTYFIFMETMSKHYCKPAEQQPERRWKKNVKHHNICMSYAKWKHKYKEIESNIFDNSITTQSWRQNACRKDFLSDENAQARYFSHQHTYQCPHLSRIHLAL